MEYGKIVNGEITNWIDINPLDDLKIGKAIAKGYLPTIDGDKPAYNPTTQRLAVSEYVIGEDSITRNWEAVSLPAGQIQANALARAHKNQEATRKLKAKYNLKRGRFVEVIKNIGGL